MWRFLYFDELDGYYSAALFESIGKHVGSGLAPETILFWRVASPVVYLGYHQCVKDEIHDVFCRENNIGIIRRILGGGCGFCDRDQILFSVIGKEGNIIPDDIQDAYNKVLMGVVFALSTLGQNGQIDQERNAVYTNGRKISGNAQGRFDDVVLVNGSLLLDFDFELMDKVLKNPAKNLKSVVQAKKGMITLKDVGITEIDRIKIALRKGFELTLGINSEDGALTRSELDMTERLLAKYSNKEWTYRMDIKRALRKKIEKCGQILNNP